MNRIGVLAVIILSMSVFGSVPLAAAGTVRVPGVKAGDWAKYAFSFNQTSNVPNQTNIYPMFADLEYFKMEIQSVVNTNVTYQFIMHYRNGTEVKTSEWLDVSNGTTSYGTLLYGPIIAANLTAGDKVYLNQYNTVLNTTETGIYAGDQRVVNCLMIDQSISIPYSSQYTYIDMDFRWDQMSGIFVEVKENMTQIDTSKNYRTQVDIRLVITETDIWKPLLTMAAHVFIFPRIINLESRGKWILAFIRLPDHVNARDVVQSTIRMNGTIPIVGKPVIIAGRWLIVRFDRSEVASFILKNIGAGGRLRVVTLTITGTLREGSMFSGSDKIIIIQPHLDHWKP
jgi:hypothetical protein